MANYAYTWDDVNKKKVYAGKYSKINLSSESLPDNGVHTRFYQSNRKIVSSENSDKDLPKEYVFEDDIHGRFVITATSYPQALAEAKIRGYTREDYKQKNRKRRGAS